MAEQSGWFAKLRKDSSLPSMDEPLVKLSHKAWFIEASRLRKAVLAAHVPEDGRSADYVKCTDVRMGDS